MVNIKKFVGLCALTLSIPFVSQVHGKGFSEEEKRKLSNEWHAKSYSMDSLGITTASVQKLLESNNFEAIEKVLLKAEQEFNSDVAYEFKLLRTYEIFTGLAYVDAPNIITEIDNWIMRKPSYMAYAAKGFYLAGVAGKFRGGGTIGEIPKFNLETATKFADDAVRSLLEADKLNPGFLPTKNALVVEAMVFGNRAFGEEIAKSYLETKPNLYYFRANYLVYQQPKWGGTYADAKAFVEAAQKFGSENPRIWTLRGEVSAMQAYDFILAGKLAKAIAKYNEALSYGDRHGWLMRLAYCQQAVKDRNASIRTLERLQRYPLGPGDSFSVKKNIEAIQAGKTLSWGEFFN